MWTGRTAILSGKRCDMIHTVSAQGRGRGNGEEKKTDGIARDEEKGVTPG